jgi:flagellar biosynthesis/type III secretory pathway M-ring protein FliF/YscJ
LARKRDLKNQRFWLGTVVLAVILIFGILLTLLFSRIHHPMAQQLREAATAAQAENWEKATALAENARAEWEQYRYLISASADHEPLEQMEYLLDQLEVYAADRQKADFAALCIRLANLAEAMADTQQIRWWNLL